MFCFGIILNSSVPNAVVSDTINASSFSFSRKHNWSMSPLSFRNMLNGTFFMSNGMFCISSPCFNDSV